MLVKQAVCFLGNWAAKRVHNYQGEEIHLEADRKMWENKTQREVVRVNIKVKKRIYLKLFFFRKSLIILC